MTYSQSANPNATNSELDAKQIITQGGQMARILRLSNDQFDVLYDILEDTVDVLEDDLINDEDIKDYEAYKIYQQLKSLKETN